MGNEQQVRRGGLKNAMFEADVQVDFYKMGVLNFFEMVRNVSVGFVIRMLPSVLMKGIFKMIRSVVSVAYFIVFVVVLVLM
jgi:hypothetical protein